MIVSMPNEKRDGMVSGVGRSLCGGRYDVDGIGIGVEAFTELIVELQAMGLLDSVTVVLRKKLVRHSAVACRSLVLVLLQTSGPVCSRFITGAPCPGVPAAQSCLILNFT